MKYRLEVISIFTVILLTTSIPFSSLVLTQDCYVNIVSVSFSQSSLEVGETLQIFITYDLFYESLDPLGTGSISVTISILGESSPLALHAFSDMGFNIEKIITLDISPQTWAPNITGQIGNVKVEGWVQDSFGSMTDEVEQTFNVIRSPLTIRLTPLPSLIIYHETISFSGYLENPNNNSLQVPNHLIDIEITQEDQLIQSYTSVSTESSNFTENCDTSSIGTGFFDCNITAKENDDYMPSILSCSFYVSSANLTCQVSSNVSIIQAYYPSMTNCSVSVSAIINCQMSEHDLNDANVTCSLANSTKPMNYQELNHFSAEFSAPSYPGNYSIIIKANIAHHNSITASIPIQVIHRQALLNLESNCSEAAYGDTIQLTLHAIDETTQIPIANKLCSVYIFNQSAWNLLTQVFLDYSGSAIFSWQAQNVGDQDFKFKAMLDGYPEYTNNEIEHAVVNTREIRFVLDSTINVVRQSSVDYQLQITTLDLHPLPNISLNFVEVLTNLSWAVTSTDSSGYAVLSFFIDSDYELGIHEFSLIAQEESTIIGIVQVTMVVFAQTILELV